MGESTNACSLVPWMCCRRREDGDEKTERRRRRRVLRGLFIVGDARRRVGTEMIQLKSACRILNMFYVRPPVLPRPPADCSLVFSIYANPPPPKKKERRQSSDLTLTNADRGVNSVLERCSSYTSSVVTGGHACRSSTRSWKSSHLRAASSSSRKRASLFSSVSTSSIWTWEEAGEMN